MALVRRESWCDVRPLHRLQEQWPNGGSRHSSLCAGALTPSMIGASVDELRRNLLDERDEVFEVGFDLLNHRLLQRPRLRANAVQLSARVAASLTLV